MTERLSSAQRASVLSQSRVFAALPRSELGVLAEMMRVESFPKDSTVMEAGEPADCVYVVAEGTLAVSVGGKHVRELGAGSVLGEYGMVGNAVRTATVVAVSDALLLSIDYERFKDYLLRFPEALWVLFEGAAKRLVEAERRT
jgi:CRP-like cAMP-binding protein